MAGAKDAGAETFFVENSPLPGRIAIDKQGVNAGNSLPRQEKFYVDWASQAEVKLAWRELAGQLAARSPERNGAVKQKKMDASLNDKKYIFCPLQVPNDTQLTVYGGWTQDIQVYLQALHQASLALPKDYTLVVKEHPSSAISLTAAIRALAHDRLQLDNHTNSIELLKHAQAVIVINSSMGLEAFFFEKPVIVTGQAFYAFSHMAYQAECVDQLTRCLREPEKLGFDEQLRQTFLNYLINEYYAEDPTVSTISP